jgi:hypothetical protein
MFRPFKLKILNIYIYIYIERERERELIVYCETKGENVMNT